MNQRIAELYDKALVLEIGGDYVTGELDPIKFAELIVRECAGACLHDDWEDPRWGQFYARKIREHFGI